MKRKDWRLMMLNPRRHDRHRICDYAYLEKERGEEVARKGRDQIQGARGEGTLGERTTREMAEKRL
jgi:hypothetical protein